MKELHLTKDDFKIDWFSGTGPGGQHRNKSNNGCRITHIETGITATCQDTRSKSENQKRAFRVLASRLINYYESLEDGVTVSSDERVRTYNEHRNEVVDHASGFRQRYDYVLNKDIGDMIEARRQAKLLDEID